MLPKKPQRLQLTASLLNSWQYIFDSEDFVREAKDDVLSLEDKRELAFNAAKDKFILDLKRVKQPTTEAQEKGKQYESDVYAGKDDVFSPYVRGGAFQATFQKDVDIDGVPITFYGVLDCLKKARIMDIKRVGYYPAGGGKYKTSHQHPLYLFLVPAAIDFTYLICDDKGEHHMEHYIRENSEDILQASSQFISWLKANYDENGVNLFDIYQSNWDAKTLEENAIKRRRAENARN